MYHLGLNMHYGARDIVILQLQYRNLFDKERYLKAENKQ